MAQVTVRVLSETAVTRKPLRWVYTYSHPLDSDCPAGGARWEITIREFAPGLIDYVHPKCSRCGIDAFVDDFRKEPDTGFVPWVETKQKLVTARGRREPHRETEPIYDDGRFDNT